jgi:beta-N-acetylhexosaminidase
MGYTGVIVSDDMEMKAVRGRYPVDEQMSKAVSAGVDAFLVCSKADLQAECVESLIKLQEQSAQQEEMAEASMQRLSKQMRTRQKHASIPLPNYQPEKWDALCLEIESQSKSRLG